MHIKASSQTSSVKLLKIKVLRKILRHYRVFTVNFKHIIASWEETFYDYSICLSLVTLEQPNANT